MDDAQLLREDLDTITMSGVGTPSVPPDRVEIWLRVRGEGQDKSRAFEKAAQLSSGLLGLVHDLGIPKRRRITTGIQMDRRYDERGQPGGYRAQATFPGPDGRRRAPEQSYQPRGRRGRSACGRPLLVGQRPQPSAPGGGATRRNRRSAMRRGLCGLSGVGAGATNPGPGRGWKPTPASGQDGRDGHGAAGSGGCGPQPGRGGVWQCRTGRALDLDLRPGSEAPSNSGLRQTAEPPH